MPELQIDVTVANRFISSLSKSLQALCHGCMDFDNGIEIVGYINVNIDSGNKVDYVLNEKVLKSTTNSMTFVSNSFLAKKEQQKQTRDGCCSPIPQTQGITSYPSSRMRGVLHSSQFHRTASQYSSLSQVPGGSQKRPRADDWRPSPKKHRIPNLPAETQSFNEQNSLPSHSPLRPYSDTSFKQPQVPVSTVDSTLLLQMNIKKEVLEADNHSATDTEHMASEDQSDDQTYDSSYETSKVQIKSDPDDAKSDNGDTTLTDTTEEVASKSTDFKDTFLEPSSPNNTHPTDEDNNELDNQVPAFEQSSKSVSKVSTSPDETNVASTSADNLGDNGPGVSADIDPTSDAPIDYDQGAEDSSYSHSAYDDAGEGSSDAGQFEVIEIDDEDEDVQAMFGDSRKYARKRREQTSLENDELNLTFPSQSKTSSQSFYTQASIVGLGRPLHGNYFAQPNSSAENMQCSYCSEIFLGESNLRAHHSAYHGDMMPFSCSQCGKGYSSSRGLSHHLQSHKGKTFMCPVCDVKFTQKFTIKRHLRFVHSSAQCPTCAAVFKVGPQFDQHVLYCTP